MWVSVRRFGAVVVGLAALVMGQAPVVFGQPAQPAQAPAPRPVAPAAPAINNPNIYANPFATAGRFGGTAVMGQALQNAASVAGAGTGTLVLPGYGVETGYGKLSASYANSGLGYGSLNNANYAGGGYGFGGGFGGFGGWGTQWMMNPYEGYLRGAADITQANAQYFQTIQSAKLLRQEAIRSSIATRRALIEERDWENAHMPDPEKIRQQWLDRELQYARSSPAFTDILNASSLNALLRHLINQQSQGIKAQSAESLSDDTLKNINFTVGDNRGNVGLLKDDGKLQWPLSFQSEAFKEPRDRLNELMRKAAQSVKSGNQPPDNILNDLDANFKQMQAALDANLNDMSFDQQLESRRYLRDYVKPAITALKDPNVVNHFNGNLTPKAKSVAELVQFMRDKGLWFAPATPGSEAAYRSLYYSLAAFDAKLPRVASSSSDSER
jgi:hypothetical protein